MSKNLGVYTALKSAESFLTELCPTSNSKLRKIIAEQQVCYFHYIRELDNHDEVHDDDVRWLGKDWNENVGFGGKKET